ncbi:recombinase family protein [Actinocrinis sp.]|uniref:recombinase family protein n=1 Tax=Actinocrinis sp. TaxID=1920516 RepID=UPI0039C8ADEC
MAANYCASSQTPTPHRSSRGSSRCACNGHTLARITRALNDAAIPCPSAADPRRNPHHPAIAWQIPAVQAILGNPVYTGHAVWKRAVTEHELIDEDNLATGAAQHVRRVAPDQWVISLRLAHEALVSEEHCAANAPGGWKEPGTTAVPPTAVGTGTPARTAPQGGPLTRTSANPTCSPACRYSTSGSPPTVRCRLQRRGRQAPPPRRTATLEVGGKLPIRIIV